jgi:hypothetical protein
MWTIGERGKFIGKFEILSVRLLSVEPLTMLTGHVN